MCKKIQMLQFVTEDKGKLIKWCTTNTVTGMIDFIQYVLDNCNAPEKYWCIDLDNEKTYSLLGMATMFGMRKRTFDERLEGKGTFDNAKLQEVLR